MNTLLKRSDMSTNDLRFYGNASTNLELMCKDGYLHGHKRILASKFHTFLEAFFPSCKYLHDGEKPWPLAPPSSHVLYKTKICYYVERGRLRLCSLRCRPPPPTSKSMLLWGVVHTDCTCIANTPEGPLLRLLDHLHPELFPV